MIPKITKAKKAKTNAKKTFHITTISNCELNFFTTAKNHKEALLSLINDSFDYKNILNDDVDFTIKIKKL